MNECLGVLSGPMILVLALSACSTTEPLRPEGMRRSKSPSTAGASAPRSSTRPSGSPPPSGEETVAGVQITPPMRFAVIGDFGTGDAIQEAVAGRMCSWRRDHPFRLVFTTGDNVYPYGERARFGPAFFDPFRCLRRDGAMFHASLGNHDWYTNEGRPELNEPAFGMPGRNYVVRRGGVRFVIADSTALDRDRLRTLLRPDTGDRWTVVLFHHPVFSPGTGHGSTPGFRPGLPRMFQRRGVDLVLNGHDHIYAASKPLHRIRYVVTGGGGAPLYGCRPAWYVSRCVERHHFLYVVARSERLIVRAVPRAGPPFHRFEANGR